MMSKKQKAATLPKVTTFNIARSSSYTKSFPLSKKFDYLLGIALLALLNPSNSKSSTNELLSVIEDVLVLKAELGLYGEVRCG